MPYVKKKRSWKYILKHKTFRTRNLFSVICIILSIMTCFFLNVSKIIPSGTITLITLGLFLGNILGIIGINVHKKKPMKVLGAILLIICVITIGFTINYLIISKQFIRKLMSNQNSYNKTTYCVITNQKNEIKEEDITGDIITYTDLFNLEGSLKKLNSKYNVKASGENTIQDVLDKIYTNEYPLALVDYSLYEKFVTSIDYYPTADYKVLYTFDVYTKKKKNQEDKSNAYNIYIEVTNPSGLTDFHIIATINLKTNDILLTILPINSYLKTPKNQYDQLRYLKTYGPTIPRESIEETLGMKFDYSMSIQSKNLVNFFKTFDQIEYCGTRKEQTIYTAVLNPYEEVGEKVAIEDSCQDYSALEILTILKDEDKEKIEAIFNTLTEEMKDTSWIHIQEDLNRIANLMETDLSKEALEKLFKKTLNQNVKWNVEVQVLKGTTIKQPILQTYFTEESTLLKEESIKESVSKINEVLK